MLRNTLVSYGRVARYLHWSIALLILSLIGVGLWMVDLPDTPLKGTFYTLHKSLGVIALGMVAFRIYWRLTSSTPALPPELALWQQQAAKANHLILYLYMIAMTLSGVLMSLLGKYGINWFGILQISLPYQNAALSQKLHTLHVTLTNYIWLFLGAHIIVAFYHHFVLKDKTLLRMWKG